MKSIYRLRFVFLLLSIALAAFSGTAQQISLKKAVESQNYVFNAQFVMPMRGPTRQLTPGYDVKVSPKTVSAYLPYFGRAYTAPIDPSQGGIRLNTDDFEYSLKRQKTGWQVQITPKDKPDIRKITLAITESGNTIVTVLTNSREPISYSGYVAAPSSKD